MGFLLQEQGWRLAIKESRTVLRGKIIVSWVRGKYFSEWSEVRWGQVSRWGQDGRISELCWALGYNDVVEVRMRRWHTEEEASLMEELEFSKKKRELPSTNIARRGGTYSLLPKLCQTLFLLSNDSHNTHAQAYYQAFVKGISLKIPIHLSRYTSWKV